MGREELKGMPSEDLPRQVQVTKCCASCNHYKSYSSTRGSCDLARTETVLCIWSCERWTQRDRPLPWPLAKLKPPAPGAFPYRAWKTIYLQECREHRTATKQALLGEALSASGLPAFDDPVPADKEFKDLPAAWMRLIKSIYRRTPSQAKWEYWKLYELRRERIRSILYRLRPKISKVMREWRAAYLSAHPPPPEVIQDHPREHNPLDRFSDLA